MKLDKIVTFTGTIFCVSGLSIGASSNTLEIGGLDREVIKNPITKEPYVPGSSLKGKMRSELEKKYGAYAINKETRELESRTKEPCGCGRITCPVCLIFGAHGYLYQGAPSAPTRIVVRDAPLSKESKDIISKLPDDQRGYLERKTENIIIRDAGTAGSPRTIERVSTGMSFDFEIILRVFEGDNENELIDKVKEGLELVEKSYLGGGGSRGSGQVKFNYEITCTQIQDKDNKSV